jgi:hypothetical protein
MKWDGTGFGLAGIAMLFGLIVYVWGQFLGHVGSLDVQSQYGGRKFIWTSV